MVVDLGAEAHPSVPLLGLIQLRTQVGALLA